MARVDSSLYEELDSNLFLGSEILWLYVGPQKAVCSLGYCIRRVTSQNELATERI